jgi:endoglucanase
MRAAAALVLGFATYVASAEPVTVGLDVSPPEVRPGQSATITWNAQSAKACEASGGWSGQKYVNGQETVTPKAVGTISYTITCDGVAQSKLLNVSTNAGAQTSAANAAAPSPAPAGQSAAAATEEAASPAASAPAAESSAAALPDAPIPKSAIPVVKVSGNKLVDGNGNTLQLRGVDVSALEFYPISNAGGDYWGGQRPNMKAIRAWKANAIRVPLNEQSYLGQTCYQGSPKPRGQRADPSGKYKAVVRAVVDEATSAGMYVILDLHKNAPPAVLPGSAQPVQICSISQMQQEMADAANSIAFWTALAGDYKDRPNVIFDLFNEPHIDNFVPPPGASEPNWAILRDGGTGKLIYGNDQALQQSWKSAGMQEMLDAVRATGARNVVMVSTLSWAQDLSRWLQFVPKDPAKQMALSWHAYPQYGKAYGTPEYNEPGLGNGSYRFAEGILSAGYPIIVGETGDQSSPGTRATPFIDILLPWADTHNVSVLGWGWNAWGAASANLIKDASGTPTDGYGKAFRSWLQNHH